MKVNVKSIAYHRNGVAGNGFWVVLFTTGRGKTKQNMVATVFPELGNIAVLDVDLTAIGCVAFGRNSWRGDDYEAAIRKAITEGEDAYVKSLYAAVAA